MRYATVRVAPADGEVLHPLMDELARAPSITREAIHRIELLADGSCVMLGEARGNQQRFEQIMADSEYVYDYAVTGADGQWYSYSNFEPTATSQQILRAQQTTTGLIETPIRPTPDGSIELTLVGDEQSLGEAIPPSTDDIVVELLETGDRTPRADDLFACLTERQQTVLSVAVDHGYYATPRETTHEQLATVLDCSASTVGEHIRKIESRVFSQFVD